MDFKLELIILPVTDVDRAKAFYLDRAGFRLDVDHRAGEDFRVVQFTPPGSACSVTLMRNPDAAGSVQGLHLIVTDIDAARAELADRGVDVSEVFHFGPQGQTPGPDPQRASYNSFLSFSDPDGNGGWCRRSRRARRRTDGERRPRRALTSRPLRPRAIGRVRRAGQAPSARAARALLPDARRRSTTPRTQSGGDAAGLARAPRLERRAWFRAWLYRIATNVCLDVCGRRSRPAASVTSYADVPSCSPTRTRLLDEVAADDAGRMRRHRARDHRAGVPGRAPGPPPRQRATLITRDVLGWPAAEAASLLE